MMEEELVRRRKWVDRATFLDLLGMSNLIPGPSSTELAIHLGYLYAGWPGLLIAGICFILPAMLIVLGLAYLYQRFGALPQVGWLLYGIKPVILAIVAYALWGLGKTAAKNWQTIAAGLFVMGGALLSVHPLLLLLVAGLFTMLVTNLKRPPVVVGVVVWPLFYFFLKIGSVLYGSGYVLIAFLQADLVNRYGWLTSQQLLDAIAIGQFTPGPVFTTATFIGYLVGGVPGAIAATIGIFLPAFLFVGAFTPIIRRLRRSPWFSTFLDGVNAASLGLMAAVTIQLGRAALPDWLTMMLALGSLFVLWRVKINSAWLVLAGGLIAWGSHLIVR
jgi:chromate transporter